MGFMGFRGSKLHPLHPLYPLYYIDSAMRTTWSIVLNFSYTLFYIDVSYQLLNKNLLSTCSLLIS